MSIKLIYVCDKCKSEYKKRTMVGKDFTFEFKETRRTYDSLTFSYHSVAGREQEICKFCMLKLIEESLLSAKKNINKLENYSDSCDDEEEDDK